MVSRNFLSKERRCEKGNNVEGEEEWRGRVYMQKQEARRQRIISGDGKGFDIVTNKIVDGKCINFHCLYYSFTVVRVRNPKLVLQS